MDYEALEKIGLTKSEVLVYTSLLKIGLSSTGAIVKEAGISSGKIYEILDRLIEKGLVSYSVRNNVKHFEASDPDKIRDYLERKKKAFRETESEISRILPSLKDLKISKEQEYETLVYEGYEGFKTAIFDTLRNAKGSEWLALGVSSKRSEQINRLWGNWMEERVKMKNVDERMIISNIDSIKYIKQLKKNSKFKLRIFEALTPSPISIFGDRVMIYDWEKLSIIVIKNKRIATSFKTFFESLWKISKEVKN